MRASVAIRSLVLICIALVLAVGIGFSVDVAPDQLPAPVARTFKEVFPIGTIQKLTSAEENGTTVYDFEFRAGDRDMETDIIADGTMIESTLVIAASDIPPRPMKVIQKAAKGAKLGRLEWIHTLYEIEEGKAVKLPVPQVKYAAEMTKKSKWAEIIVAPDGGVLESPVWADVVPAATPPAGGAPK